MFVHTSRTSIYFCKCSVLLSVLVVEVESFRSFCFSLFSSIHPILDLIELVSWESSLTVTNLYLSQALLARIFEHTFPFVVLSIDLLLFVLELLVDTFITDWVTQDLIKYLHVYVYIVIKLIYNNNTNDMPRSYVATHFLIISESCLLRHCVASFAIIRASTLIALGFSA